MKKNKTPETVNPKSRYSKRNQILVLGWIVNKQSLYQHWGDKNVNIDNVN